MHSPILAGTESTENCVPWTTEKYARALNQHLDSVANHQLAAYQKTYYDVFLAALGITYKSKASINKQLGAVGMFFGWCLDRKLINKPIRIPRIKVPEKKPKAPTLEEKGKIEDFLQLLQYTVRNQKTYQTLVRYFVMASQTAMRAGEIWSLFLENIDVKPGLKNYIRVENTEVGTRKGVVEWEVQERNLDYPMDKGCNDYDIAALSYFPNETSQWFYEIHVLSSGAERVYITGDYITGEYDLNKCGEKSGCSRWFRANNPSCTIGGNNYQLNAVPTLPATIQIHVVSGGMDEVVTKTISSY
ncbi:MAG: hypothetical protein GY866_37935 [Proteobacteria bacterium]|nr:hypothetical protein [Pseudomonadota bacterium]